MKARKPYSTPEATIISLTETTHLCTTSPEPRPNRYGNDEGDLGFGTDELDASLGE